MNATIELTTKQREILEHAVGAGVGTKKISHGYRNRYCVDLGSDDHVDCVVLCGLGLMRWGQIINDGRGQYFYVTAAGCQAIRLSKRAIKRALEE